MAPGRMVIDAGVLALSLGRHQHGASCLNVGDALSTTTRTILICLALFTLNAVICGPLFGVEYLDDFQSNEGSYITFGKFLLSHWPHVGWFPWFNAGMPFEDTYLPLPGAAVALTSLTSGFSPAHAFHFVAALTYSLAPVFLFLFARELSGHLAASVGAAVLWSLVSPSAVFPQILKDMGTPWGIRRLQNIVVYGETPHNMALCLLPISLLLTNRFLERPSSRRFALAALAAAAVMLTNAFGIVVVSISSIMLFASRGNYRPKSLASIGGILFLAYLAICRMLPPTLIRLIETNSQLVGGDYRFTWRTAMLAGSFLLSLIALWAVLRRLESPGTQFAALFTACFGGIALLGFHGVNLVPQPVRYHIEMEVGLCLLAAFAVGTLVRRFPHGITGGIAWVAIGALGVIAIKDYRFARELIRPATISQWAPFKEARWIAANLPGERVLIAGEGEWLFNLFTDNPQLGAGHEPSAPNWIQRVAVYTIFTGQNAGDRDAPVSILWLKAFGCGGIVVSGPASRDHYHAVINPTKFDGLLPLVWREGGDSIYRVPLRSTSLAHVIPMSAIVGRRPINGLDVDPLRPYVAALEGPSVSAANLQWENPDRGRIVANVPPDSVVSVQVTWDPGWRARVGSRQVPLTTDQLGLIVIDPQCSGKCSIDLEFDGGLERAITLWISLLTVMGLSAAAIWPGFTRRKRPRL